MEASRRDFISIGIGALGAVGGLGALYALVRVMLEPSEIAALGAKTEIDVSKIQPMQVRVTSWKGKTLFAIRLPKDFKPEGYTLKKGALNSKGTTNYEILKGHDVFALVGVCTHLGCIPLWKPQGEGGINKPVFHCPCHGGLYTPYGDVIGGPPPRPLFIPPQKLEGNKLIVGVEGFVKELI
ncbi:ubiquinol-cytochrome c reductase iron-sulfur subunit [Aquifex aeolicus]|uniref:Rieske-I iron sulfur protein n=1 Tax=Aquifex aeolicus (strain VF5) TaxID=224324 RepID=O66460_AQUAE|nr:ubiquinol-cytochrome c reductase iron-sulfur subunit [Aquifex aeolicus]6KLS_A Chain A, Rieske-I iron sulfur protein [Aquifex aeolicus VF5]6KLS_D Chain D, Rieske-I iron sulfur protein [Aquifex aeolicus VF5]6KLV_A Chain A, Rieske-I iron sulfur protein [Aquifex aeolicus VF5]6KLV_D Chain D, Rieske-I iron sulfur protein [Aquifex aeolicus VF5]AAC06423.1 Rieske-I iron sulfur protein [Aquifex aeolicus VF5]